MMAYLASRPESLYMFGGSPRHFAGSGPSWLAAPLWRESSTRTLRSRIWSWFPMRLRGASEGFVDYEAKPSATFTATSPRAPRKVWCRARTVQAQHAVGRAGPFGSLPPLVGEPHPRLGVSGEVGQPRLPESTLSRKREVPSAEPLGEGVRLRPSHQVLPGPRVGPHRGGVQCTGGRSLESLLPGTKDRTGGASRHAPRRAGTGHKLLESGEKKE